MTSKTNADTGAGSAPLQIEIGVIYDLGEVTFSPDDIRLCQQAFKSSNPIHDLGGGVAFGAQELGLVTERLRDWAVGTDLPCRNKIAVVKVEELEFLALVTHRLVGRLMVMVSDLTEYWAGRGECAQLVGMEIEFDFQIQRVSRKTGELENDLLCWGTLRGSGKP